MIDFVGWFSSDAAPHETQSDIGEVHPGDDADAIAASIELGLGETNTMSWTFSPNAYAAHSRMAILPYAEEPEPPEDDFAAIMRRRWEGY